MYTALTVISLIHQAGAVTKELLRRLHLVEKYMEVSKSLKKDHQLPQLKNVFTFQLHTLKHNLIIMLPQVKLVFRDPAQLIWSQMPAEIAWFTAVSRW